MSDYSYIGPLITPEQERQARLDAFACAALTVILSDGTPLVNQDVETAWDYAAAMESERELRLERKP